VSPRLSDLLLSSQSDERLVSLARAGHDRAFAAIVERYRPELQAMAQRLCSDGRGEDVVQQAFLSAFAALRSGCEVRHLRGWLYQIVRNAAGRPQPPVCVPLDGTTPGVNGVEEVVQQRALAMTALSEIARLPARQRQAMIGTALDGRGRAEIASSMGLSEGAVRQLVHRARTTLRSAMTAVTPWPLARWLAAAGPDAPGPTEVAAGAGAASSGGLALKLGALLASGTVLTGAAVHLQAPSPHRGDVRGARTAHGRPAVARARPVTVASVAAPLLGAGGSSRRGTTNAASGHLTPARALQRSVHPGGHAGTRSEARPVEIRRDGHRDRNDHGDSGGEAGREGTGALSAPKSGSGSDRHGDGQTSGGDGGTDSSGKDGGTTSGSDAQVASASQPVQATVDGSDSRDGSDSGSSSLDGSSSLGTGSSGSSGDSTTSGVSDSGPGSGSSDGGGTSGG
jgi:RNA polymerase sigma factor (sigma-70 family)